MTASAYQWLADSLPVGEEGQPLLDIGFYVTFFFDDSRFVERRRAVYEIMKEYWFRVGEHLRWTTNLKTHVWERVTPKHSADVWLAAQPNEPWVWDVNIHGGETFDAASPYRFTGLGAPRGRRAMSFMKAMFPVTWLAEHPEASAVDIVQRWATLLQPHHGTAGLSIVASLDQSAASRTKEQARGLAERLPGLEVDD